MGPADHIATLAASHERDFATRLNSALAAIFDTIDTDILASILDDTDANHIRAQLAMALDLDEADLPPGLTEGKADLLALLLGLMVAVAAHAAAQASHTINSRDTMLTAAQQEASRLLAQFYADTALALASAIEAAIYGPGSTYSRATQLRRSIGLTIKQAGSLDIMRGVLQQYLAAPQKLIPARIDGNGVRIPPMVVRDVDTRRLLASTRGHLSGAQRQILAKALNDPKLTPAHAEAILDRHADALRTHRIRAVAGEMIHNLTETAKLTGWRIAQRAGALPSDQRRHWKTAGDERVRHAHAQVPTMNPTGVSLDQPFKTPLGEQFTPPLEYGCRCKAVLAAA